MINRRSMIVALGAAIAQAEDVNGDGVSMELDLASGPDMSVYHEPRDVDTRPSKPRRPNNSHPRSYRGG